MHDIYIYRNPLFGHRVFRAA